MKRILFKSVFTMLAIAFAVTAYAQQTGSIKGKVLTSDGNPADMISIMLTGTNLGTVTNAKGEYKINNVKPGTYTIKASAVGASAQQQNVSVTPGQTTSADFNIAYSSSELKEVNISAGRTNKFAKTKSEYVAKISLNNLENPQVYTTVTGELLKEQLATTQDQALQNVPGLYRIWNATNRSGDGGSYFALRGFTTQSLLRNGVVGQVTANGDLANVDRIEVLKGPSGTLFGGVITSYGGLINRVTKQPYDTLGGELTYLTGSFGKTRLQADFNAPLNKEKTALFRINAAYDKGNSFQDQGFSKSTFVAPSFTYQISDKVKLSLDAEFLDQTATSMPLLYIYYLTTPNLLNIHDASEIKMDWKRSYIDDDLTTATKSANVFTKLDAKLSENWSSQTIFTTTNNTANGIGTWLYLKPNEMLSRNAWYWNGRDNSFELQHNFIGDLKTGSIRHRVVAGVDALISETKTERRTLARPASPDGYQFDEISYTAANQATYGNFNKINLEQALVNGNSGINATRFSTYSAYVSDVINITDQLIANVAVRFDHYYNDGDKNVLTGLRAKNTNQNYFSPKFGLLYQILKDQVSAFANYQNGFKNVTTVNADGSTFDPERAQQFEGGFKLNLFGNKLAANLSYYDIKVDNVVLAVAGGAPGTFAQDGTGQRSKGFEADFSLNPVVGLNINAGYAYNNSILQSTNPAQQSLRPVTAGPKNLLNFWASYTFENTALKGFGAGFGGNYGSKTYAFNQYVGADQQTLSLPSYTVFNASIFYNTGKFRIAGKLDNLTDELYWNGYTTINVQNPRTFTGSIAYKF